MAALVPNVLFGIVTFREQYADCSSFQSLLTSFREAKTGEKLTVFVFDNTDSPNWKVGEDSGENGVEVHCFHAPENPGISVAYNHIAEFAKENRYDWVVFLDQDSVLESSAYRLYQQFAAENAEEVAAPKVLYDEKIISPSKYHHFRTSLFASLPKTLDLNGDITFINSGLIIKTDLFFKAGKYDENLRLDFCDHEFAGRLSKVTSKLRVLDFSIFQNFSTETNSLEKSIFRYRLFKKDLLAYSKIHHHNSKIFLFVDWPHLLRLSWQYRTLKFFKIRFLNG